MNPPRPTAHRGRFVSLGQNLGHLVSLGQDERDWLASVKVGWPNKF